MTYDHSDHTLLDIIAVLAVQNDLQDLVHRKGPATLAIVVPERLPKSNIAEAIMGWLRSTFSEKHHEAKDNGRFGRRQSRDFVSSTLVNAVKDIKRDHATAQDAHWLLFVDNPALLDERLRVALDAVIVIDVTPAVVQQAAVLFDAQTLSDEEADYVATLTGRDLELFFRRGRPIAELVQKLMAMKSSSTRDVDISAPRLEDLCGYGAAKDWGMELAIDLKEWTEGKLRWRDVDCGILLSGPPGCGKTTFAAALARTCGVEFVATSYAQWQSRGHQGDMLKAMRATFEKAIAGAPCILLIDEIDSFPNRDADHGDSSSYVRGVVNGLLEQLDGAEGREGVIVVGACNNPAILDPAIVRSGRLDRHVEIALPDEAGRLGVLDFHLAGHTIPGLIEIAEQSMGMSGADLERVVREARRAARREHRPIRLSDLQASMPAGIRLSDERLWASAVHEIGHAVVGAVLQRGQINSIRITADIYPGTHYLGAVTFAQDATARQTRSRIADQLAVYLAGMVAEQMLLGDHDEGCASDLAAATREAAVAVGAIGMGASLVSVGAVTSATDIETFRRFNPRLDQEIDQMLKSAADRAREILQQHRDVVQNLSGRLFKDKTLDPDAVYAALPATLVGRTDVLSW